MSPNNHDILTTMITWLINNGIVVLGFGGYAAAGLYFALVSLGFFKDKDDNRRDESDGLADTLINRLKETVEQLQKDFASSETARAQMAQQHEIQQKEMSEKYKDLQEDIKLLQDTLALRDEAAQRVFKQAPTIFALAEDHYALSKATAESLGELVKSMNTFIKTFTSKTV